MSFRSRGGTGRSEASLIVAATSTAATRRTIDLQTLHQICERLTVRMLALQLRRFLPGCPVDRLDLLLGHRLELYCLPLKKNG